MDHARSSVSNLFGGHSLSNSRLRLTEEMVGTSNHVEMTPVAKDGDNGKNNIEKNRWQSAKPKIIAGTICVVIAIMICFFVGFKGWNFFDYKEKGINNQCSNNSEQETKLRDDTIMKLRPRLSWDVFKGKLDAENLINTVRTLSEKYPAHETGSKDEEMLGYFIYRQWKALKMDVWKDDRYVKLQFKSRVSENSVTILDENGNSKETMYVQAYVAYSDNSTVTGPLVYANYGSQDDFKELKMNNVAVNGSVVLVRAGKLSFAEKVANAEASNAVGVLIYLARSDFGLIDADTVPFGHAHLGTGDPFTPGFPSFNHTQFPPSQSLGLPKIPVQTISRKQALKLFSGMNNGNYCSQSWTGDSLCKISSTMNVRLTVNNVLEERKLVNIFGVIKGSAEPDRYVVVGAQRDAWGPGVAKSLVGTSILLEMARVYSDLVFKGDYKPQRSIIFASWSGGEFGAVGATEWLESYLSTLQLRAVSYINLDSAVLGSNNFKVSASPLLYKLIEKTMIEVNHPITGKALFTDWNRKVEPLTLANAAYPFLAYSGIPSVSFHFYEDTAYQYLNTRLDTYEELIKNIPQLKEVIYAAAQVTGHIMMRLTHLHYLFLDFETYNEELSRFGRKLWPYTPYLKSLNLSLRWLYHAHGSFSRATNDLKKDAFFSNTRDNLLLNREINDRIMRVEYAFLSPYASPKETPFLHIIWGSGPHTLSALLNHLQLLENEDTNFNETLFRNQLALATCTIQGAANALTGNIWDIEKEF